MKVLVTGSSGFLGSALTRSLTTGGHSVTRLVRPGTKPGPSQIVWDPSAGRLDPNSIEGFDAVLSLAGENIAGGRWTPERKRLLRDSRVKSTLLLAETLARLSRQPRVLVAASATGYYGDRGDEMLTEASAPGSGFLAEVCRAWEDSTRPAAAAGIRVVNVRFGIVLSAAGGALAKMLPPFKAGVGGPVGSGRQYMSWIALDDVVRVIEHAFVTDSLAGPVNVVAPEPLTNREFARTLGRVLGRPALLPLPAFAVRLLFGEMGDALLIASARVRPSRLEAANYRFLYPELEGALRRLLGR
ncbi:MAG TPA: TIGR01777 family oxidoreductase [Terriglobia bacterium]|nr:TIGR01777 family oxidoreductase [Terriglobia bacterium]